MNHWTLRGYTAPRLHRWSLPAADTLLSILLALLFSPPLFSVGPGSQPAPEALPERTERIEISKGARELRIYTASGSVDSFPVGLGFEPMADKRRQGDGATPEGDYVVCIKNPHSRYYLSLGLNYPSASDAERALSDGRITEEQRAAIVRAEESGVCPPWNTPLGGEIFIHGRGAASDWTLGCVALEDPAMRALFDATEVGVEVKILP